MKKKIKFSLRYEQREGSVPKGQRKMTSYKGY